MENKKHVPWRVDKPEDDEECICELCGSDDAELVIDPFEEDMNCRYITRWLCSNCYNNIAGDI